MITTPRFVPESLSQTQSVYTAGSQLKLTACFLLRAPIARHTLARHTLARHTLARHTLARHTLARHTLARHTLARYTVVRLAVASSDVRVSIQQQLADFRAAGRTAKPLQNFRRLQQATQSRKNLQVGTSVPREH